MEHAVQIHEIVKNIIKFLPYQDVKNARLVNKLWNNEANPILRERSGNLRVNLAHLESYVTDEQKFASQDLAVRLPFEVIIHDIHQACLIQAMEQPPVWFPRVKVFHLSGFNTVEMNRLLPHMLHALPCLEVLGLQCLEFRGEDRFQELKLEAVSEEVQFSLVSIRIPFECYYPDQFETGLDPRFLRKCPKLKSFAAVLWSTSQTQFLNFLESWKAIRSADMRYELLHFEAYGCGLERYANSRIVNELVEFISINQPKSLTLDSAFLDLDLMGRWTSVLSSGLTGTSVRSLEVPMAADYRDERIHGHTLKNLRKCAAFAKVTALTLNMSDHNHNHEWVRPLDTAGPVLHSLDQVTSLTIRGSLPAFENWTEIAKHLPNVTSLAIAIRRRRESKYHFKGLSLFDGLREFSWVIPQIWGPEEQLEKLLQKKGTRAEGCLDDIMTLKGLRKLKLTVQTEGTLKLDTLMLLLFGEYLHEPQMELEIDRCVYPSKDGHARCSRGKIRLSPEEFKKALKQASDTVKILEEQKQEPEGETHVFMSPRNKRSRLN